MRPLGFLLAFSSVLFAAPGSRRLLTLDDFYAMKRVADPQVSPDGKLVAYTVTSVDKEADKQITHIWMANWDGSGELQLTYDTESASSPLWSPDSKYLAFLSSRPGKAKGSQIWVLDRRGGEARQLTRVKDQNITQFEWAPDSNRLALVLRDREEAAAEAAPEPEKRPKPIVIDRYHFKEDREGYLAVALHNHLYILDPASGKLDQLTTGNHDESAIAWSPDGSRIAFVSNQDPDPDRSLNSDVFVVEAHPGATPQRLTTFKGPDSGPLAWSPDSKLIAYVQGSDPKYSAYSMDRLAVAPAAGGPSRILTSTLDRGVFTPQFTAAGNSLLMRVADDRSEYVSQISVNGGSPDRIVPGKLVISGLSSRAGHTAVVSSTDQAADEIYALEGGALRKLSRQNERLLEDLLLGSVEDISFRSKDGTEVHALLTFPPGIDRSKKYPTLLRIHGGPNGQDDHQFEFANQFLAANDYLVIAVNYRGSSGRGEKYGQSIFGDWGDKEVADLLAGVDDVVSMGIADPDRIGIGGWSYGGLLTDYTIASTSRFKAAISGAGSALQLSMYGIDQYVYQYDNELGPPWKNPDAWMKVSYPFFKADRIRTPTLFMGGDKDFNVPLAGGEQMYQALRSLGVPTELIVYPGEFHGFQRPSFLADRYVRYLAWYDKYLKPANSNQPVSR